MTTPYAGYPSNESLHGVNNILSSTNATPIELTFTANHDINDGDFVLVRDHALNFTANGIFAALVTAPNKIKLYASVKPGSVVSGPIAGTAVGGNSGTVCSLGVNPNFPLPSDSDLDASDINPPLEDAGDRGAFILSKCGPYKPVFVSLQNSNDLASAASAPNVYGGGSVGGTALDMTWRRQALGGPILLDAFLSAAPDVLDGDLLEVDYSAIVSVDNTVAGAAPLYFAVGVEFFETGASPSVAIDGAATKIAGSGVLVPKSGSAGDIFPINPRGRLLVANGVSRFKKMQLYVVARCVSGTNAAYKFLDDFQWGVRILRPTGLWE